MSRLSCVRASWSSPLLRSKRKSRVHCSRGRCEEDAYKPSDQRWGMLLRSPPWSLWPCMRGQSTAGRRSAVDQRFCSSLASRCPSKRRCRIQGWPSGAWEGRMGPKMSLVGNYPMDHDISGKVCVVYNRDLLHVFAYSLVFLLVTLTVLIEVPFIREELEHSSGPMFQLAEWGHWLGLHRFLGGLFDEHAVGPAVGGETNTLLARWTDLQLVAAHVSGSFPVDPRNSPCRLLPSAKWSALAVLCSNSILKENRNNGEQCSGKAKRSCECNLSCKIFYVTVVVHQTKVFQELYLTATACTNCFM